jgi:SAM-dependent methyltransferase
MTQAREQYTMGYGPAATAIMGQRTARSHASFLLPYLKAGMSLLDCGCGPGTITVDFAEVLAPGEVVGTEIEDAQVRIARDHAASRDVSNVRFEVGSIYGLPFPDNSFDAVFISAILGNLREPLRGLHEIFRVLKPGGVIGVKEFDHGGDIVYPIDAGLQRFSDLYVRLRREHGHDGESGRKIGTFLNAVGFRDLKVNASYENVSEPQMLGAVAKLNIGLLAEGWAEEFKNRNWATADDCAEMIESWKKFSVTPGALLAFTWCEAVAFK